MMVATTTAATVMALTGEAVTPTLPLKTTTTAVANVINTALHANIVAHADAIVEAAEAVTTDVEAQFPEQELAQGAEAAPQE